MEENTDAVTDPAVEGKPKKRKRLKKLFAQIKSTMEFYFSDSSLAKDRYLKKLIDASQDRSVQLDEFLKFNKLKNICDDLGLIARALRESDKLEISPGGLTVRRVKPFVPPKDVDDRTIYVENLPSAADHDWVRQRFSDFGEITYVSLPRYRDGNFKGFGFVEFESVEDAVKACQQMNESRFESVDQVKTFSRPVRQVALLRTQIYHYNKGMRPPKFFAQPLCNLTQNKSFKSHTRLITEKSNYQKPNHNKSLNNISDTNTKSNNLINKIDTNQACDLVNNKDLEENSEKKETEAQKPNLEREPKDNLSDEPSRLAENIKKSSKRCLEQKSAEEPPVKHVRLCDEVQEIKIETEKRIRPRKKKRKEVDKDAVDPPQLRVMPKKEWLQFRTEYLETQKQNLKELKQSIKQLKLGGHQNEEPAMNEEPNQDTPAPPTKQPITFTPGVIVSVSTETPSTRKQLKDSISQLGDVAYVDYQDNYTRGHIRCHDSETASKIAACESHLYKFNVLSGDDEKLYWEKLKNDREKKRTSKSKTKKHGSQKIIEKAEILAGKILPKGHILFSDD